MEALFVRCPWWCVYHTQESPIWVYSNGVESLINKVVGIVWRLWHDCSLSPWQGQCGCGCSKSYDLTKVFYYEGLEKDIAEFVTKCPNCQQVEVEHQKRGGLLQEIQVPTWKWEDINMDFVVGLPRIQKQYDSIWVVVDRFTKSTHLILIKSTFLEEYYARIFTYEIVYHHGIPLSIITDRGAQFTYSFWRSFQEG